MALSWSMDKVGPISRSALDNAIVLAVLNGSDTKDPSTIPAAFNYSAKKDVKKLKIGYFSSFFEGNRAGIENDRAVLELLKNQGMTLHPVELKTSINAAPLVSMLLVEGAAAFDDLTRLGLDDQLVAQHKSAWPNVFRAARFIPAVEYIQMSRQRSVLIEGIRCDRYTILCRAAASDHQPNGSSSLVPSQWIWREWQSNIHYLIVQPL
jgi:Asp-tRNA(Asn)/Glu-tRNA(Gln) amidotransferase A subunit family amidase